MADRWHVTWLREGVVAWNKRRSRVKFSPDLSGLSFQEILPVDFRDDPKASRYFEGIDLSESDLSGAELSNLNFQRSRFDHANLSRASISNSNLRKCKFLGGRLTDADLSGSWLEGAVFENTSLERVFLKDAGLRGAVYIGEVVPDVLQAAYASSKIEFYTSRNAMRAARSVYEQTVARGADEPTKVDPEKTHKNVYDVFFGTTRRPVFERGALVDFTATDRRKMSYGVAEVTIPAQHRLGNIGPSLWRRLFNKKPDEVKRTALISLNEELFFKILQQVNAKTNKIHRPTIFVHGYNNTFDDAVVRAAQFGHDLGLSQGIGLFSWPTKGETQEYPADEATVERNKYNLADFIECFSVAFPEKGVSLVAHSMGCRCLLGALEVLASRNSGALTSLHQVVLAAADVDAGTMPNIGQHATTNADRTTSYVGNRDKALKLSKWLHGFSRVGLKPPTFTMTGLDTIIVNEKELGALAHGYVASSRAVLNDIHALLQSNMPPSDRFSIKAVDQHAGLTVWKLVD
ncbi:MAG: alpha/beta hydrolase [Pseudomonadota bacterium]